MKIIPPSITALTGAFALMASMVLTTNAVAQTYYPEGGGMKLFNPYPNDTGRGANQPWRVRYFGPVGIGIDLIRPGMTMRISNVEEGSPADKTGKLEKGQIIESINGVVMEKIDPRIILGDIITQAEATDGEINLKIKGEGNVLVKIPVMGSYSETWPLDCPKSDKIVRKLADLIAEQEQPQWGSVIFLLSTGEEKDLDVVRKWMKGIETIGGMNWEKGYKGWGLCEYYLRTGDESVLPVIKKMTEELKENMYNGGWSGRGKPAAFTYSTGTGQVHASGMNCMTFVLMANCVEWTWMITCLMNLSSSSTALPVTATFPTVTDLRKAVSAIMGKPAAWPCPWRSLRNSHQREKTPYMLMHVTIRR